MNRQGAIGALLDEYERSIEHLKSVITTIPDQALTVIADPHTKDENCKSVQTVLSHVVHSGYSYATTIYNQKGHNKTRRDKVFHLTVAEYLEDLKNAFKFTEEVLSEFSDEDVEQLDNALKMKTGWGQLYDIEQLMEHAIVHILRHRRQLEKFKNIILLPR
jgi:uncharacterized damage-inducible protein DinB